MSDPVNTSELQKRAEALARDLTSRSNSEFHCYDWEESDSPVDAVRDLVLRHFAPEIDRLRDALKHCHDTLQKHHPSVGLGAYIERILVTRHFSDPLDVDRKTPSAEERAQRIESQTCWEPRKAAITREIRKAERLAEQRGREQALKDTEMAVDLALNRDHHQAAVIAISAIRALPSEPPEPTE